MNELNLKTEFRSSLMRYLIENTFSSLEEKHRGGWAFFGIYRPIQRLTIPVFVHNKNRLPLLIWYKHFPLRYVSDTALLLLGCLSGARLVI